MDELRGQECFCRGKCLGGKAELPQQIREGLADRLVVVDDRDE